MFVLFQHTRYILCRVCEAVAKFLCEAVILVSRKPADFFGLVLAAKTAETTDTEVSPLSLLSLAALRQGIKVSQSTKIPPHTRAAIAGYVSGAPSPSKHL